MMLGASCDGDTSEVSKPEKDVEPDAEPLPQLALGSRPQSSAGQMQQTDREGVGTRDLRRGDGKRVARLLEHFCSQLARQHPGDQSGTTQQGRSAGAPEAEGVPPSHQAEQRSSEGQASPQARREEPSQEWSPYWPSESNLRLLAAKGLEWRVDSRAHPRGAHAPFHIPHRGDSMWRYLRVDAFSGDDAQRQSQLL